MSSAKAVTEPTKADPTAAPGHSRSGRKSSKHKLEDRPLWLLIPGGVLMLLIIVLPLGIAVFISLHGLVANNLRKWTTAPFVGLQNYISAIQDWPFFSSIWITVSYGLLSAVIALPLGIAAALATQNTFKGRAIIRSIYLIPYVLPAFVVATLWRTMFQLDGPINNLLAGVGIDVGLWLNGPLSYWVLVIVQIWASWPFFYLLVLAGLQSVDLEVHEAAAIDGARWWSKLRYVVFPYLRGSIFLAFIISFLHNMNQFTLPYVLFGLPMPRDVNVLTVLTYTAGFQNFQFGVSAALAIFSLILICIPLFIYLRAVQLDTGDKDER